MPEASNTTVLVTGGAGYIGSHSCKALAAAGYDPVVVDSLEYGHQWAVRWGPLEQCDLLDQPHLNQIFREYRPSAVLHFAGYTYVGESVRAPLKYYRNNVNGTAILLDVMRDHEVPHIVFSSTCATYGVPEESPITEDHPQTPINPYGASKLMVERMLSDCAHVYDLRHMSLRYFNAAGADPDGEIGEDHEPETHLIPLVLKTALGRHDPLQVFGDDYETPDGSCIRDYIHVTDLAEAHVLALKALQDGQDSAAYNLGTGTGHSVWEIIEAARRITGEDFPVTIAPRREGDPPELVADASRVREALGWAPRHSDLETILRTAWNWHRKHEGADKNA